MAAVGFTPISLYYSTTALAAPIPGNLVDGELAINITDGKLYYKDNTGAVKLLASNGTSNPVTSLSFGTTGLTPSTATTGNIVVGGTLVVNNGGTGLTSLSTGRIPFGAGSSAFGNSTNLFFDSVNTRLGVGTSTPAITLELVGSDAMLVPKGNTASRPTNVAGYLRFNTQTSEFEGNNGTLWSPINGTSIVNDVSTAGNLYPLFANSISGTATTIYTSNAKYLYTPSTGELRSSFVNASSGIFVNNTTVSANYTIAAGSNGFSVGPITTAPGISVTVTPGQRWVVI